MLCVEISPLYRSRNYDFSRFLTIASISIITFRLYTHYYKISGLPHLSRHAPLTRLRHRALAACLP